MSEWRVVVLHDDIAPETERVTIGSDEPLRAGWVVLAVLRPCPAECHMGLAWGPGEPVECRVCGGGFYVPYGVGAGFVKRSYTRPCPEDEAVTLDYADLTHLQLPDDGAVSVRSWLKVNA